MKFLTIVFVVLGIITSYLFTAVIFSYCPAAASPDPEAGLVMLLYYPLGLFLASILTGFLCGLTLEDKSNLFFVAPGLYLCCLCPAFIFSSPTALTLIYLFLIYPASLAGTFLGYLLMYLLKKLRLNS